MRYASEPPKDFASAAGHWYMPDGSPFYTIVGANGNERPVTLRDARKVNAVPSVTGIIRMAAAPALEKWKRNQVMLACLTLPRHAGENEMDWLRRVEQDWQEQGRDAADRGTAIHGAIERHFRGEIPDPDMWEWVKAVKTEIDQQCGEQNWRPERSFAHPLGYGGKTDLHSPEWIIDHKGKEGDATGATHAIYDEHAMQGAAYRRGLGFPNARVGINFFGRDVPSAKFVEIAEPDLVKGLAMFDALLAYWKAKNGYWPNVMPRAA